LKSSRTSARAFRYTLTLAIRLKKGEPNVALGIVKWFNPTKGYGFIKPDGGGPDIFVHVSAVQKAGYTNLAEGARISYELFTGRNGKTSAENLRLG
jgi:CspA family cold shock protein